MNPVFFAVVAALALHSAYGCSFEIDDLRSTKQTIGGKRKADGKWEITFKEEVDGGKLNAVLANQRWTIGMINGDLCNYENDDQGGLVAQLVIKALGDKGSCKIEKGTWDVDGKGEIDQKYCDEILTKKLKSKESSITMTNIIQKDGKKIGAVSLILKY